MAYPYKPPSLLENQSADDIHRRMMNALPDYIDKSELQIPWDFTRPAAIEKAEFVQFELNEAIKLVFPHWAYGHWLDLHAQAVGLERRLANRAYGTLTVRAALGTVVAAGFQFATPANLTASVVFPQTCTWSIAIWEWMYDITTDESLPLSTRQGKIISKMLQLPPTNPSRIEAALSALTGAPVKITENIAPYTFRVVVDESHFTAYNHSAALRLLRNSKPSHLSFHYESRKSAEFTAYDHSLGAAADFLREFIIEEIEPVTTIASFDAGGVFEVTRDFIKEAYIE